MKFKEGIRHFAYLWKGAGFRVAIEHAAASFVSRIYQRKRWYLTLVHLDPGYGTSFDDLVDAYGSGTLIVENMDELESYRNEFHSGLNFDNVKTFMSESEDRFAALARRPDPDGSGHVVVAYRVCERGRFRFWDDKADLKLGPEFFAVYNKTVAPECRGQNLSEFMRRRLFDYCRKEGIRTQVGIIGVHNVPSIRSFYKHDAGYTPAIIGVIERTRVFGGVIDRHTPEEAIQQLVLDSATNVERPTRFELRLALGNLAGNTPTSGQRP